MTALRICDITDQPIATPRTETPDCHLCGAFANASAAPRSPFAPGEQLFRQGDPVRLVYRIVKGAAVSYRLLSDGRRQVTGFHLAGDFVGLEAGVEHSTTAEALSTVHASAIERTELADRAATDNSLARALWQVTVRAVRRSEDHALILARQGATERVAAFLLDFAERQGHPEFIDLPMTRQDIADHVGLTIHTVSRTLSQLQAEGLIEARSTRHVRLLQRGRLECICA
ncbi:helix-turn-helix domain-containing protein [Brevundimonas sp.]|uniref:helix-turn-helix domain-containing protein n=1 Tax=Brevundimonas sp. TaxID=1871086 RepID=UPI002D3E1050|nr:helix-turn-helix domain-containing protein [Brevundimonas sp.]HYD27046.1 helix-turn-helix domain-containing protein [Brevundimonas sp.]